MMADILFLEYTSTVCFSFFFINISLDSFIIIDQKGRNQCIVRTAGRLPVKDLFQPC